MPKNYQEKQELCSHFKNFGIVFSSVQSVLYRIRNNSDRGVQYVSSDYIKATAGICRSYSKKAYPWDNACIESFHALIKREWLNRFKIFDYNQAYRLVFQYIDAFYNTVRIHSHCGYLSPNEYEAKYWDKLDELEWHENNSEAC